MFSLFIRTYIESFVAMIFFGIMFFMNLDMVYQKSSILTEIGIPNFVGWIVPLFLSLYFLVFFIFHNRHIYGCKKSKKSLISLFLIISIIYSIFSIILLGYIFTGSYELWMIASFIIYLTIKNIYIYFKIKKKKFFHKIHKKKFFRSISIYGTVGILALLFYIRPIPNIDIPQGYFNINMVSNSNYISSVELFGDLQIDAQLKNISDKNDKKADYETIIYNFSEDTLLEIDNILKKSSNIEVLNPQVNYTFHKVKEIQNINLLKFEYEILNSENKQAIETLQKILYINSILRNGYNNFDTFLEYIEIEKNVLDRIESYQQIFSDEQKESIYNILPDLQLNTLWKNALEKDFYYRIGQISHYYDVPLFLDKKEMFNLALYIEYLHSNNKENLTDFATFSRKNYIGIKLIQNSTKKHKSEFDTVKDLIKKYNNIKNTLN